jgi:ketosteroid isomerase-like protein
MSSGRDVLEHLYDAFGRADGPAMAACYAPDARFSDPVYPELSGAAVGAMWRMLTGRAQNLRIEVRDLQADDSSGRATWLATYLFGPARRPVANLVHSSFDLADGLITAQRDTFDFHAWAAQALGAKGRLLGWTPLVRNAVRAQAAKGLEAYLAAEST